MRIIRFDAWVDFASGGNEKRWEDIGILIPGLILE
jgi:hypothetical protein